MCSTRCSLVALMCGKGSSDHNFSHTHPHMCNQAQVIQPLSAKDEPQHPTSPAIFLGSAQLACTVRNTVTADSGRGSCSPPLFSSSHLRQEFTWPGFFHGLYCCTTRHNRQEFVPANTETNTKNTINIRGGYPQGKAQRGGMAGGGGRRT